MSTTNNQGYRRALHWLDLVKKTFPNVGAGDWAHQWKENNHCIDLSMRHWWDGVVKRIVLNGVVSAEWLCHPAMVSNLALTPAVLQGLFFPCAIVWKETMHRWNRNGKANYRLHLTESQKSQWNNVQQIGKGTNALAGDGRRRPGKTPSPANPPSYNLQ